MNVKHMREKSKPIKGTVKKGGKNCLKKEKVLRV